MTSDEIQKRVQIAGERMPLWEIAYQLAVMNERNECPSCAHEDDQVLGSTVPPDSESALRWTVEQPPADAYEHHGLPAGHYWVWYETDWIIGKWDGEDWVLSNGIITTSRHVIRGLRIADSPKTPPIYTFDERTPVGGPPTPDLAAQPDSTPKESL
jgi:hypothetical protein